MKEIYKGRVTNSLESSITKLTVVQEMVTGKRPADSKMADSNLQQVIKVLGEIQEVVERG